MSLSFLKFNERFVPSCTGFRSVMHCDKHNSEQLHDVFHDWILAFKKDGLLISLVH
jgi:hypothetical protein